MMKKYVQKLFLKLGYEIRRVKTANNINKIDPLDRNLKGTLDKLWDDPGFKKNYINPRRKNLYNVIETTAKEYGLLNDDDSVLDVGCGPGFMIEHLKSNGYKGQISGCDFSESAIKHAKEQQPDGHFFVHDIYKPIPDSYDALFCIETLEHLLRPDLALATLENAARYIICTVPEGRKDNFRGHINFWSKESFEQFISLHLNNKRLLKVEEVNESHNLIAVIG